MWTVAISEPLEVTGMVTKDSVAERDGDGTDAGRGGGAVGVAQLTRGSGRKRGRPPPRIGIPRRRAIGSVCVIVFQEA